MRVKETIHVLIHPPGAGCKSPREKPGAVELMAKPAVEEAFGLFPEHENPAAIPIIRRPRLTAR
ncbi:MAG: hypothetical protein AB1646_20670 [Thermodesulfobacteriota bacterium]